VAAVDTFEVLHPGILTTVQDLGRPGFARYGVAPSGALDGFALRVANLLAGNPEDAAALETAVMGLRLKALRDVVVAVTGADLKPIRGREPLAMWRSHRIRAGEVIAFPGPAGGMRSYISVSGGIDVTPVLGSRSTNLTSGFGGVAGRALRKGDILRRTVVENELRFAGRAFEPARVPEYPSRWRLRVVWGPQDDQFAEDGRQTFVTGIFRVSPDSDRTGIRLKGPAVSRHPGLSESIISEGVIAGAVQVPGDGQPIIILAETTTGGYRKIATVISADLPLLGQIMPGNEVAFSAVTLNEAVQALRESEEKIGEFKKRLAAMS
jgi:antagonist of KipI